MMRVLNGLILVAALMVMAVLPAEAAKRVALVIGNDAYDSVPVLQKARNDADAMAKALIKLGFEVVSAKDVGRRAMSRALVEFEAKIEEGDTALLFFAGHGFAIQGTNYLLPVDSCRASSLNVRMPDCSLASDLSPTSSISSAGPGLVYPGAHSFCTGHAG